MEDLISVPPLPGTLGSRPPLSRGPRAPGAFPEPPWGFRAPPGDPGGPRDPRGPDPPVPPRDPPRGPRDPRGPDPPGDPGPPRKGGSDPPDPLRTPPVKRLCFRVDQGASV